MGLVSMHEPEKWGYLQFADENVGSTPIERDPTWPLRKAVAAVWWAEYEWAQKHQGHYTNSSSALLSVTPADVADIFHGGACAQEPMVTLGPDAKTFEARVKSTTGKHVAV